MGVVRTRATGRGGGSLGGGRRLSYSYLQLARISLVFGTCHEMSAISPSPRLLVLVTCEHEPRMLHYAVFSFFLFISSFPSEGPLRMGVTYAVRFV